MAARDGVALLVGGTGLYLRAVARGLDLDALPDDPAVRARLEAEFAAEGLEPLAARLQATCPGTRGRGPPGQPAAGDPRARDRRAARRWSAARGRVATTGRSTWIGLDVERAEHERRIAARARAQFDAGLVDEAVALRERFDPTLPAFSAIGYQEAWAVADATMTRDQAIEEDARRNVAFAKRQRTWFRAEPDVTWLPATDGSVRPRGRSGPGGRR